MPTAVITGAGIRIGKAIALALAEAGYDLALHLHRSTGGAEEVAGKARALGRTATLHRADLGTAQGVESLATALREAHPVIDVLVNNAGIAESAPFHKMTRESWDRIISVNLTGAFDTVQAGLPDLLKSEDARVVFIASVASLRGVPYAAHYAASKHGLLGLMRSMAAEYAKSKMTVNAVCPGYVDTPMTDQSVARVSQITGRGEGDARSAITNMNASGRLVDPQAIANLVLTLCLPLSRDINGAAITIDGGTSA